MRTLIIGLGCVCGAAGFLLAYMSFGRVHDKARDVQRAAAQILAVEQKIVSLRTLPQRPAVALDTAYVALVNDMRLIARAHQLLFTISFQGGRGLDIKDNARPSEFSGLREIDLHGVFSGLQRRSRLLSVLDALSAFEKKEPVLFRSIGHEKDVLVFDITLVGL